jgi:hypothetical protein
LELWGNPILRRSLGDPWAETAFTQVLKNPFTVHPDGNMPRAAPPVSGAGRMAGGGTCSSLWNDAGLC